MPTETAHNQEKTMQDAALPRVAAAVAAEPLVEERVAKPPGAVIAESAVTPAPVSPPKKTADEIPGIAGWFARNRWFTKEPVSYLGFQFARAAAATIPYGFGMAAGHHAFGLMGAKGQKMGLTQAGIDEFNKAGIGAVDKKLTEEVTAAKASRIKELGRELNAAEKVAAEILGTAKIYEPDLRGSVGRNMMRLAGSPLNAAVQIALGFTMFRFTGGIVKNLRDRVMNEKNTPEETQAEVKHAGKTIVESMKINWPAERTGTPIAALVLGFMNAAYVPAMAAVRNPQKKFMNQVGELWGPKSKLLQNAAVWTASYSLFFLLAESLFRDKQLQRGYWKGHPNSLKNGPDDTVGGPGAISYTPPGGDKAPVVSATDAFKKPDDDVAKDSSDKLRFPGLTGEPSAGRFLIRRVLPVAVGISAYAALKRVGYIANIPLPGIKGNYMADVEKGIGEASRNLNGPMEAITVKVVDALAVEGNKAKTLGNHAKFYLKNAYREGKATIMFGALWAATDAWGSFYDKFVHNLQKPENQVPLNAHQQDKHAELLARLNTKELGAGRAA